jgi:hypothetical protein
MKTHEIANANNKLIQQKIVAEIKQMPIISKHFEDAFILVHDENFNLPIADISSKEKSQITKLIQDA